MLSPQDLQHLKSSPPVAAASKLEHKLSAITASISTLSTSNPTPDRATLQSWSLELLGELQFHSGTKSIF
jgi:hypothetical protein